MGDRLRQGVQLGEELAERARQGGRATSGRGGAGQRRVGEGAVGEGGSGRCVPPRPRDGDRQTPRKDGQGPPLASVVGYGIRDLADLDRDPAGGLHDFAAEAAAERAQGRDRSNAGERPRDPFGQGRGGAHPLDHASYVSRVTMRSYARLAFTGGACRTAFTSSKPSSSNMARLRGL